MMKPFAGILAIACMISFYGCGHGSPAAGGGLDTTKQIKKT